MKSIMKLVLTAIVWVLGVSSALAADEFWFGDVSVDRGERVDFSLSVPPGLTDPATFIPLTVIRGTSDGPTVVIVAGVHGFEFAPMLAVDRITNELAPEEMSGTLVFVRVANVAGFESRSPYVNPYDRKNLNRSFPGSANGTQTERIAHLLSTIVIPRADFLFDVHCGDGAEWLEEFVGVYGGPLSTDYETALGVARAMGFPNIVRYSMNTQAQVDTGRSLNRQGVAQGVPTVLVEAGENGRRDEEMIDLITSGLRRSFAYLGVLPNEDSSVDNRPRLFDNSRSVVVNNSGIWNPTQRIGRVIEKGETLGIIKGYDGELLETVQAPVSGYAIYGLAGPPVREGDSVMSIAFPVSSLD